MFPVEHVPVDAWPILDAIDSVVFYSCVTVVEENVTCYSNSRSPVGVFTLDDRSPELVASVTC